MYGKPHLITQNNHGINLKRNQTFHH